MKKGISINNFKKVSSVILTATLVVSGFFVADFASAAATVYPADGGTNISIDTTLEGGSGTFTELEGPVITESEGGDIAVGTHTIMLPSTLPSGWEFDTSLNITISKIIGNIVLGSTSVTPTQTSFSFAVSGQSTSPSILSLSGLKVRPMGITPTTGEITHSGALIVGVVDGSTNFGTLTTVVGETAQLKIETAPDGNGGEVTAQQITSGDSITVYSIERDQFNNFRANTSAGWSLIDKSGGVADGDLIPSGDSKSATLTGNLVGSAVIQAQAGSFTAVSGLLTVVPGSPDADQSSIMVEPTTAIVSDGSDPAKLITATVTAKDAADNVVSNANTIIAVSGSDNTIIPSSLTTNEEGIAVFTISSLKAEEKIVTATINDIEITQTQAVTFIPDVSAQLSISVQPSATAVAGESFSQQPVIQILDQFGNLCVNDNSTIVTAVRNPGSGSKDLKGATEPPLTAAAVNGVATFSGLYYEEATTISIDFTSGDLIPIISGDIIVSPAVPAEIVFTTQPASVSGDTVDNPLSTQPVVKVTDGFDNNVADGTEVALALGSGEGVLRGTLTKTTIGGEASFNNIGYSKIDEFNITATAGEVSIISNSIGPLEAGIINNFTLIAPSSVTAGISFEVEVTGAVDQFDNLTSGLAILSVASGDGAAPNGAVPTLGNIDIASGSGSNTRIILVNAVPTVLRGTVGSVVADIASITVNPGDPSQVVLTSNKESISANNTDSATITGQLKDEFGNDALVPDISVAISTNKGTITQDISTTDANGQVTGMLTSQVYPTTVTANITATAGELTIIGTSVILLDVTAPAAPIIISPETEVFVNADTYSIAGTAEVNALVQIYDFSEVVTSQQLTGGEVNFDISTPLGQDTVNNFTVTAEDAAGNESEPATVPTINEDSTPPAVSIYELDNSAISPSISPTIKDSATIDVEFSEPVEADIDILDNQGNKVKDLYYSAEVTNPDPQVWNGKDDLNAFVEDGVYTIKIVITDKAENSITDISKTITVDNSAPAVGVIGAPAGLTVDKNGVTAEATCDDGVNDCQESKLYVSSAPVTDCSTILYANYGVSTQTITTHSYVCAYAKDNAGNENFSSPAVEFNIFSTIQSAIDAAASNDTINIVAGTYNEKLDLKGKSLDIVGTGVDSTIIDASSLTGYAVQNFGDFSTIKGLTLKGTTDSYGFKISHVNNITLENIKVESSYKTGIDLNTVNGATLNNIEVTNTIWGFGLMILNSNNIDVTDITTSNNTWGGVSVQTSESPGSSGITFNGTFGAQDNFPFLLENDPDSSGYYYDITNITLPINFGYIVYDFRAPDNYKQWYYFETLGSAKTVAQGFVGSTDPTYSDVVIYDIAEKNYYVEEDMLIQDAIDAASSGDTIQVAAGTYTEDITIDRSLTLQGENKEITEINFGYDSYPSTSPLTISSDEVVVSGFTIRSGPYIEPSWTIVVGGNSIQLTDLHVIKESLKWGNDTPKLTSGAAVYITPGINGFTFTDSIVDSAWNGIYAPRNPGSSTIIVQNVDFTYPGEYAILLMETTGATIENNIFTCMGHGISGKSSNGVIVTRGSNDIEIRENQFIGSQPLVVSHIGILLQAYAGGTMGNVNILENEISNFNIGVEVEDVATLGISIHYNTITGNTYGVKKEGSNIVNAERNWWGVAVPDFDTIISGDVDYDPWYLDETMETLSSEIGQEIIYVDDDYDESLTEEGLYFGFNAFAIIQEGIDAVTSGGTVNVAAGTYNESLLIEKSLTLNGTGERPVITGDDSVSNYIVKIDGTSNVTISNLGINGGGSGTDDNAFDYGLLVNDSDEVDIDNCTVKNIWKTSSNSIGVEGSTDVDIYNSVISSFHKRGIRYINSGGIFHDNEIIGDNVDGTNRVQNLVNLWGGSNVEIYNNTLYNALATVEEPTWDSPGIFVSSYGGDGASYANIHDNEIYNCDSGIVVGSVYADTDTSSADIINNNLHNLKWAINFEKNTVQATITGNSFTDNEINLRAVDGPSNVNAERNWWGTIDRTIITFQISGSVDYRPWCTENTCTIEDYDAPTIDSYTPSDNTVGVDPTGNITVTFDDPVNITASDIELKKSEAAELTSVTVTFNDENNKATIDPDVTLDDNSVYTIEVKTSVDDLAGNLLEEGKTWSFTTAASYFIELKTGWNLISLPVTPTTWSNTSDVLVDISDNVDRVWSYDAVSGDWFIYTGNPDTDNLNIMTAGHGYWVKMTGDDTLTGVGTLYEQLIPSGDAPPSQLPEIPLAEGWNLIGYYQLPGEANALITDALSKLNGAWSGNDSGNDLITFTKGTLQPIRSVTTMNPGEGYWIFMTSSRIYSFGN